MMLPMLSVIPITFMNCLFFSISLWAVERFFANIPLLFEIPDLKSVKDGFWFHELQEKCFSWRPKFIIFKFLFYEVIQTTVLRPNSDHRRNLLLAQLLFVKGD